MKYLKRYSVFESNKIFESDNLDSMANQFIADISKSYDLRFGKEFDKNKANCAWFTDEFYKWSKSKGLDVKVVYFDSNIEAHIAPMIDGKVIDFAVKQFTKNPNDDYLILTPEDYKKYGYDKFEIWDEMPKLQTVFSADRIFESDQICDLKRYSVFESKKDDALQELTDMLVSWVFEDNDIDASDWEIDSDYMSGKIERGVDLHEQKKHISVKMDLDKYNSVFEKIEVDIARAIRETTGMSLSAGYNEYTQKLKIYLYDDRITTSDLISDLGLSYAVRHMNRVPYLVALASREEALAAMKHLEKAGIYGEQRLFIELFDFLEEKSGKKDMKVAIRVELFLIGERYSQKVAFAFEELKQSPWESPVFYIDTSHTESPYVFKRMGGASWATWPVDKYIKINT